MPPYNGLLAITPNTYPKETLLGTLSVKTKMCPKEDQPPSNTHSMSPTINDETKRPSTFAEPNCKHCHLKKQRNPSPENEWIPASFNECCAMLKMIAVVWLIHYGYGYYGNMGS